MKGLIERTELLERSMPVREFMRNNLDLHVVSVNQIRRTPTIAAEPVRHGRWIEVDRKTWRTGDGSKIDTTVEEKCSCCGCYVVRYETVSQENYCPSCGAKMDAEVQDG